MNAEIPLPHMEYILKPFLLFFLSSVICSTGSCCLWQIPEENATTEKMSWQNNTKQDTETLSKYTVKGRGWDVLYCSQVSIQSQNRRIPQVGRHSQGSSPTPALHKTTKIKLYVWDHCPKALWTLAAWDHAYCPGQPVSCPPRSGAESFPGPKSDLLLRCLSTEIHHSHGEDSFLKLVLSCPHTYAMNMLMPLHPRASRAGCVF